jgi:hypothetical protein
MRNQAVLASRGKPWRQRMFRKTLLSLPLVLLFAAPAVGEWADVESALVSTSGDGDNVRVRVHVSFFVAGPADDSDASLKAQEDARRKLYESAARECDELRATIASTCRVESINANINRNYRSRQADGFNVSGNFGFRVTLK